MAAELVQGLVSSTSRVSYFLLETLLSQEFATYHSFVSQLANEGEEDIAQILRKSISNKCWSHYCTHMAHAPH